MKVSDIVTNLSTVMYANLNERNMYHRKRNITMPEKKLALERLILEYHAVLIARAYFKSLDQELELDTISFPKQV